MVEVFILLQQAKGRKENGKMGKELNGMEKTIKELKTMILTDVPFQTDCYK